MSLAIRSPVTKDFEDELYFQLYFKRHFRDLSMMDKQKVLTIIMAMLRSTTFNKGTPKLPHNLQLLIDLAFTKIPTMDKFKGRSSSCAEFPLG